MNQATMAVGSVSSGLGAVIPLTSSAAPLAREARLDLLRGMLVRLAEATPAGQYYLMAKVLPLLHEEASERGQRFRLRDRELITRLLDDLEREASRLAPDPTIFTGKAQILVDVLALDR